MVQRSHGTSRCDPPPLGKQQRTSPRPSPGSAGEREVVRGVITQVSPSAGQQSWREPFDYTFLSKQHKATGSVIGSPPSAGLREKPEGEARLPRMGLSRGDPALLWSHDGQELGCGGCRAPEAWVGAGLR